MRMFWIPPYLIAMGLTAFRARILRHLLLDRYVQGFQLIERVCRPPATQQRPGSGPYL